MSIEATTWQPQPSTWSSHRPRPEEYSRGQGPTKFQPKQLGPPGQKFNHPELTTKTITAGQWNLVTDNQTSVINVSLPASPTMGHFTLPMGRFDLFLHGALATMKGTKHSPLCTDLDEFCMTWWELPPDLWITQASPISQHYCAYHFTLNAFRMAWLVSPLGMNSAGAPLR